MIAFVHPAHARRFAVLVVAAALALVAFAGEGTASRSSHIRGLSAGSVSSTLVHRGFACTGPRQAGSRLFWLCQKTSGAVDEYVHVWGTDPARIDTIDAGVICFECDVTRSAKRLFGLVAGLSLSSKQPAVARTWIAQSVKAGGALDWRGLTLRIDAKPGARELSIAPR